MRLLLFLVLSVSAYGQILDPILQGAPAAGGATFSRVGTAGNNVNTSGTALTVTMPQAQTNNDLSVCVVGVLGGSAGITATVQDSATNVYSTFTSIDDVNHNAYCYVKYRTISGSPTTAISLTTSAGTKAAMVCGQYHRTSGAWATDTSVTATNAFTGSGAITTAAATTSGPNLLIGCADQSSTITPNASWTANGGWSVFGNSDLTVTVPFVALADQLNVASDSPTLDLTFAPAGGGIIWAAILASFK